MMKKALLIAEKPSLMLAIQSAYKNNRGSIPYEIDFTTFAGHVMGLVQPQEYNEVWKKWDMAQLPMIPEKFIFKPTKDKIKMYNDVKKMVKDGGYDFGIVATDPGREGELIAWAFLDEIKTKMEWKRLWFSDLTDGELTRAMKNLREYDTVLEGIKAASYKRAELDWLIGMNFTRAYSMKTNIKGTLGRVMTPTLKIVVDREKELKNFKPTTFWEAKADFYRNGQKSYEGIYVDDEGNSSFLDKSKAEAFLSGLSTTGTVAKVDVKKDVKYAPELHSLANLQNECNRLFGYTMSETLAVTQSLYEKKLLSYPRTDSAHLTEAISKEFSKMLKPLLSIPELAKETNAVLQDASVLAAVGKNKKYVNDKKVSDHYAITPTGIVPDMSKLTKDEVNVYTTVAKRFLAIFLPPMITEKTTIYTDVGNARFKTNGSVLKDIGFMKIYPSKKNDSLLPPVKEGESYDVGKTNLIEKQTTPPPRYNDESLNKIMENVSRLIEDDELKEVMKEQKGIGTPATRGSIVDKLVKLGFMERRKKSFYATEEGIVLIDGLGDLNIVSPTLTAEWETKLIQMEEAKYDPNQFTKEVNTYIHETIEQIKNLTLSDKMKALGSQHNGGQKREVICKCPVCGGDILETNKYFLCSNYKNPCTVLVGKTINGAKITKTDAKALFSGKETKEKEFTWKSGKKGKAKLAFTTKLEFRFK